MGVRGDLVREEITMQRALFVGLLAAVVVSACSSTGDDDDGSGSSTGTGGAPPSGASGTTGGGSGGTPATSTGGSSTTGGNAGAPGSGGATAGSSGESGAGSGGVTGSGGMTGSGGAAETADAGTLPMTNFKPPCITGGADLALIGDSYVNYINNLEPRLTQMAIDDGAIASGEGFDDHAVAGTSLANAFLLIPPQWEGSDGAKTYVLTPRRMMRASPPKFIVMDGGGNDIIIGNPMCEADGVGKEMDPSCMASANDAREEAFRIMTDMKASGVKQVLYFYYPNVPIGGHDVLEWAFGLATKDCEDISDDTFQCMMVDLRPVFEGHPEWVSGDGIHPTAEGADHIAETLWSTMKTACMAQSAESGGGCCTP
jgi:hypothetical protein